MNVHTICGIIDCLFPFIDLLKNNGMIKFIHSTVVVTNSGILSIITVWLGSHYHRSLQYQLFQCQLKDRVSCNVIVIIIIIILYQIIQISLY